MSVSPVEPQSLGDLSPDDVARALREQLAAAKRRMRAYRDEMEACGLAQASQPDGADPSTDADRAGLQS